MHLGKCTTWTKLTLPFYKKGKLIWYLEGLQGSSYREELTFCDELKISIFFNKIIFKNFILFILHYGYSTVVSSSCYWLSLPFDINSMLLSKQFCKSQWIGSSRIASHLVQTQWLFPAPPHTHGNTRQPRKDINSHIGEVCGMRGLAAKSRLLRVKERKITEYILL